MFAMRAVNNERCAQAARWVLAIMLVAVATARADDGVAEETFAIPPAPSEAAPRHVLDVHFGVSTALQNESLCPAGSGCVFQSGGGIGASLERRWPTGFGAMLGFDLWFLDTDSVYELGVQQALRAGARYTMPTDILFHPVFELSLGATGYGDTFSIATVGFVAQAFAGGEIELSETFGLIGGFGLRAFSHSEFRTERDRILRGRDGVFSEALFFQLGLTVM
jgi:hypothetical protein